MIFRERLQRRGVHRPIPLDVFRQIVGRLEIVVVGVESIGNAAEAAKTLEAADDVRLDCVACAFDLTRIHGRRTEGVQLFIDRFLELLDRVPGTRRRFDPNLQAVRALVEGRAQRIRVCTRCLKAGKVVKAA